MAQPRSVRFRFPQQLATAGRVVGVPRFRVFWLGQIGRRPALLLTLNSRRNGAASFRPISVSTTACDGRTGRWRSSISSILAGTDRTAAGLAFDAELPQEWRSLVPSDFGFHNSLRRPDGSLAFLDFEYFGWDRSDGGRPCF